MKMRVWAFLCLLLMISSQANAQISFTWNEWFKQKKTELKYLGQQIAELQSYLQLVKQGYKVVDQGSKIIRKARNGELTLHDAFYLSLKIVNQRIKNYPAVGKTIDHHKFIARKSQELIKRSRDNDNLHEQDKVYVKNTMDKLREDMSASLDELMTLLTDHQLELSDNERIKRIEGLEHYAHQRVLFMQSYYGHVMGMVADRISEKAEISVLSDLHGIK